MASEMKDITIRPASFQDDYDEIFCIRDTVYVKSQNCPYDEEFDGFDEEAEHFLAYQGDEVVGYCRLRVVEGKAKHERYAVYEQFRGTGVGKQLVLFLIQYCKDKGYEKQYLNAQVVAQGFYEKLGFRARGNRFMEAGIVHTTMDFIT